MVKTIERKYTNTSINNSLFLSPYTNRQLHRRHRSNFIESSIENKRNTHKTQPEMWIQKKIQKTFTNKSLFLISSTDNGIGDTGATSLSEALKSNTTLTKLDLDCEDERRHTKGIHQQFTLFLAQSERHWWRELKVEMGDSHCLPKRHRKGEERKRKKCVSLFMSFFMEDDTTKHIPHLSVQIEAVAWRTH